MRGRASLSVLLLASGFLGACGDDPLPPPPPPLRPEITAVQSARPVVNGSLLRVMGYDLEVVGGEGVLKITARGNEVELDMARGAGEDELLFAMDSTAVRELGSGVQNAEAVLSGNGVASDPFPFTLEIASTITLSLDEVPTGERSRNEVAVLHGSGFIAPGEGMLSARFEGDFTPDGAGDVVAVSARLTVTPAERFARDRGIVVLSTELGGAAPGTFEGTIQLVRRLGTGTEEMTDAVPCAMHFGPPDLFGLEPRMFSLGQYVSVMGTGFLGGGNESTIIRLRGTFTPPGMTAQPFEGELVPEFISGNLVRFVVESEPRAGRLVSSVFEAARGTFMGTATPVVVQGVTEYEGPPTPIMFTLGPIRQVVLLRLLPGFFEVLPRFGLEAAALEIEEGIAARIEEIYADYNVDVRLETPVDFAASGYATLEIGGPDPSGGVLFGYDNTPGKDVGNLRLFDQIGGAYAEEQEDGEPGYGGVFTENYLWWSSHPELPQGRPSIAPPPDPLFDEIFDPVRRQRATLAEVQGEGDSERVAAVERAVNAFASLVGETSAHELGHSFGLAQPFGSRMSFHNDTDGDGCLMDSGADRPVGERTKQDGYARTQFCHREPEYLNQILGN